MIAVLVPAHDEETLIGDCMVSIRRAAAAYERCGESVCVVVALDRCSDRTGEIARAHGAATVCLDAANVGRARAVAADHAIALGARWLATTDADTVVPTDWLTAQLASGADAYCGVVAVRDWGDYAPGVARTFDRLQQSHDGHPHVHGANMGVRVDAYQRCGGFRPMRCNEDVALIDALLASGARVARRGDPRVYTSARRHARAAGGFSDYLKALESQLEPALARPLP